MDVLVTQVTPPFVLDIAATASGALTGGLFAVRRNIPTTGFFFIVTANAFGGGVLRDVLLGRVPPVAIEFPRYIITAVICGSLCFFLASIVRRLTYLFEIVDALALSLFAVVGASIALAIHLSAWSAIVIGAINAIGGGLLRDVIAGERPEVVKPGPISQFAAIISAVIYVLLIRGLHLSTGVSTWVAITLGFGVRLFAMWRGTVAPMPVDLSHHLKRVWWRQGP